MDSQLSAVLSWSFINNASPVPTARSHATQVARTFQMPRLGELMRCTSCPSSVISSRPDVALSRRPTADRNGRRRLNLHRQQQRVAARR